MKKNIGKALALYPAPLIVVGSMVDGNELDARRACRHHGSQPSDALDGR